MTVIPSTSPSHGLPKPGLSVGLVGSRNSVLAEVSLALMIIALLGFSARDGLANLYDRWLYEPEYGYGFLVAPLVPWLLWSRAVPAKSVTARSCWVGITVVVVAQIVNVFAVLSESYYVEQAAFVFSLFGVSLAVFRMRVWSTLPLLALLLMTIPLPYTLQAILTIKLQLLSTNIGVFLIRLIGVPVYVEGNIIDLGIYKLQVAEACSGLRYLLPLTCLSFLVAYLYRGGFWKKTIVVLSAAPLTIGINSFRIAVTAVLVNNFGPQSADGFLHQFEGWVVFIIGVSLLCGEILVLEGFKLRKIEFEGFWNRQGNSRPVRIFDQVARPLLAIALISAIGLGFSTSLALALKSNRAPARTDFAEFPANVGQWIGSKQALDPTTLEMLKANDYYLADYHKVPGSEPINFFVAYYAALNKGAAIHSPKVCLPGSGWEFASFEERRFSEIRPGSRGNYNRAVIQNGTRKILMYYWYQQGPRRTASEFSMKYYLLVDSLTKHRQDGALVRLFTPISPEAGARAEEQAELRLRAFTQELLPKLPTYLPQ